VSGFVVCPACGTRIKAGRRHCLRCFETLPDPDVPVRPPIWESLALSQGAKMAVGIGASALVVALVGVIWSTWPAPIDDEARPAVGGTAAPARPAALSPASTIPNQTDPAPLEQAAEIVEAKPRELSSADRASLEASRGAYEQALAKTPDDPEALNNLGQTLARLNRPEEALPRFARAVELAPTNARYHINMARTASTLGQGSRAVAEYREAVGLLPEDYAMRYTLAVTLQKNGDHASALPEFERAIALAPTDASLHRAYAVSLEQLQRVPEAVREYRRYLEMRPSAPDAAGLRAHIEGLRSGEP
jgi:tetratricopeptide (TPR) repeat protein